MSTLTRPQLSTLAPHALPVYVRAFDFADAVLPAYSIATSLRVQHLLAQVLHETNGLQILRENMNYSAEALTEMFGSRITPAQAQEVGRTDAHPANQQAVANIIYGGAWGLKNLGNTQPADGWDFRGCYLLQHTGRDFFSRMSVKFGVPLASIADPSKVDARIILMMACEEWTEKGCNVLADADDLDGVTRKINGGTNGLDKRAVWLARVKKVVA